jgi:hypothetical protein
MTLVALLGMPGSAASGEELVCALRGDWTEASRDCPCEEGWKPTRTQLAEILKTADERGFNPALAPAVLCNADLRGAQFSGAAMDGAYLNGADLRNASLRGVSGKQAVLENAKL